MKKFKRFASVVMVIMMMLSMMLPAMAATITVDGTRAGETYSAYKIFDVTNSGTNYAYTIAGGSVWKELVDDYTIDHDNNSETPELDVFTLTPSENNTGVLVVTINEYATGDVDENDKPVMASLFKSDAAAADFAAYLEAGMPTNAVAAKTVTAVDDNTETEGVDESVTVVLEDLEAGYYFVTTSLGSLCALETATDTQEVKEKNTNLPTLEKKILVNGEEVDATSADIGDEINFEITVTDGTGTNKMITVHDTMGNALTLDKESFSITVDGKAVDVANYTIEYDQDDDDEDATNALCTFHIVFNADYVKSLAEGEQILITYTATVNENILNATADDVVKNSAHLTYSEQTTPPDENDVYTSTVVIDKNDGEGEKLAGAKFVLYKEVEVETEEDKTTEIVKKYYVYVEATETTAAYVQWVDSVEDAEVVVTDTNGAATFKGLADGTYYLLETEAPAGYNLLTDPVTVVIAGKNGDAYSLTTTQGVVNNSGTELPTTGGIGTTIFYCLGGAMVLGAFVLLITKKRMSREM